MARSVSTRLYIFSFIATVLIFSLGLSIGLLVEKERLDVFNELNLDQEVGLKSLQLQQVFVDSGELNCEALKEILEATVQEVSASTNTVTGYSENSIIDDDLFQLQLRNYFLTEIQYLTLANEIQESCGAETVTIVYFYDENEQDVQGDVLSYLKSIYDSKLLVFSFDSNFDEEPMIDVLLKSYEVTQFPTVVVNGEVYQGGLSSEALRELICVELDFAHEDCVENVSEI